MLTDSDKKRLAEARARCEAASEGPWHVEHENSVFAGERFVAGMGYAHNRDPIARPTNRANAEMVAADRSDLPWALDLVERLEAALFETLRSTPTYEQAIKERDAAIARAEEAEERLKLADALYDCAVVVAAEDEGVEYMRDALKEYRRAKEAK